MRNDLLSLSAGLWQFPEHLPLTTRYGFIAKSESTVGERGDEYSMSIENLRKSLQKGTLVYVQSPAVATIPDCAITQDIPQIIKLTIVNCSKLDAVKETTKTMTD